ncbi:hypothetical protein MMC06_004078, partial [Schaereria dolodes]|nr:hypothetical protein [Schaereria dolodes]
MVNSLPPAPAPPPPQQQQQLSTPPPPYVSSSLSIPHSLTPKKASESDLQRAFRSGDNDADDGLSISEAANALRSLSGKTVDPATVEAAWTTCGVDMSREMS